MEVFDMLYNLRVCIHPDSWEQQIDDLLWACSYAGIEEVLLCEQPYHVAPVLQPFEYHQKMKKAYSEVIPLLQKRGIRTSMYIKASVGHGCNCKVNLKFPFQKFMGHLLKASAFEPCLLDPAWQDYMAKVLGEYAKLGFEKIMIDDDFRSVNRSGGQVGCFCALHAQKVSELLGMAIDSEQLLAHVVRNDEKSLRVRKAWLDLNYAGQLAAITKFARAIHAESPKTLFGLMNSGVGSDAMQGRKIKELLRAAAGENKPLSRPAGGAYQDTAKDGIVEMHTRTAQSMVNQGDNVYYVSEVENFPRNIFSKSRTLLDLHLSIHALLGVSELTLNIFDHYQTPIKYSMEYLDLLKENKAKYTELNSLTKGKKLAGIGFPWHEEICYRLKNRNNSPKEIGFWQKLDTSFLRMGLPVQYTKGELNCLEGDLVLCYSDKELEELLSGGLLLDRIAAENLCERGFADCIGTNFKEQYLAPCYERFSSKTFNPKYHNQYTPIFNGEDGALSASLFSAEAGATFASELLDIDKKRIGPGTILYENKLGGRICTFATPFLEGNNWNIKCRQEQLQKIISWLTCGNYPLILENCVNVMPLLYRGDLKSLLVLVNTGFDPQWVELAGAIAASLPKKQVELAPFELKYFLL
jgi:hypothetical protein